MKEQTPQPEKLNRETNRTHFNKIPLAKLTANESALSRWNLTWRSAAQMRLRWLDWGWQQGLLPTDAAPEPGKTENNEE